MLPESILNLSRDKPKTALIVKFGQIGDVIMAIPAVRLLYEQGYRIHWACGAAARPLLKNYDWIHVIPVDDKAILRGSISERARGIGSFWSKVLGRKYDLCATLYYDRRFHMVTLPIRGRRLLLSHDRRETELIAGRHHTDEYARILLAYEDGCRPESLAPVRPDRLPPALLPEHTGQRRIALAPGGTSNVMGEQTVRRWPVESYVQVAQLLLARGWDVVLIGGPEDAWVRRSFDGLPVKDYMGKTTLAETISVCDACDALITHDTGPLHLGGLSRAKLVGLFGPTNPATFLPRRSEAVGIWGGEGFACRPCHDGHSFAPCKFNGCMHQIKPEQVIDDLDRLLGDSDKGLTAQPSGS